QTACRLGVAPSGLMDVRLEPPASPGNQAATLNRSGGRAYFRDLKPFRLSQSYTHWPATPALPVGLSMLPSASARSITSWRSIRLITSSGFIMSCVLHYRDLVL